ncbi:MAG: hypothetical protein ABII80_02425 [bacterium]
MSKRSSIMVHKNLYYIAIATLVGSVFWTAFGIYSALSSGADKVEVSKEILDPLNPTIDTQTLDDLFVRREVLEGVDLSTLVNQPEIEENLDVALETEATKSAAIDSVALNGATESAVASGSSVPE